MKERAGKSSDAPDRGRPDRQNAASQLLRRRAEARLRRQSSDESPLSAAQLKRLVHELRVHQIELEMQNEELLRAQSELAQARDRFSDLYNFAPVGYLTMDLRGVICEANLTLEKLLGLSRVDIVGKKLSRFVTRESQDSLYLHRCEVFGSGQRRACELTLRRHDGGRWKVQLESIADTSPSSSTCCCQSVVVDVTQLKQANEALSAGRKALETANAKLEKLNRELENRVTQKTARLRNLARRLTQVEERERRRVAYVLHEGLQQLLVGALFTLQDLKGRIRDCTLQEQIVEVADIIDQSVQLARTVTYEVYPPVLHDLGIADSLRWLARQCQKRYGLSVTVQTKGKLEVESEEVQTFLFRATQELLLNVAKHAQAKAAKVRLIVLAGREVRLQVSDWGAGFDPAGARASEGKDGGFGLFSLRERAEMLGGHLEIASTPGRGTTVAVVIFASTGPTSHVARRTAPMAPPKAAL